jgi:hypothetical protein
VEVGILEALCAALSTPDEKIICVVLEGIKNFMRESAKLNGNPYYRRLRAVKADVQIMELQKHSSSSKIARLAGKICEFLVMRPEWSTDDHWMWPEDFRAAVRTMLLVHARVSATPFSLLPHDVVLRVVETLAADWELDERRFKKEE